MKLMKASALSFRAAVLFAIAGMGMGIAMAIGQDHSVMPAHAHLNLLGWVSLFLFGIYYRLHPGADVSRLALAHVGIWCVGTVALAIAVAAIHLGHTAAEPVAAIGSLVLLGDMLLFAVLVFRATIPARPAAVALTPAE
jgi:hypothetical protein